MRAIVVALVMVVSGAAWACTPADIEVSQLNWIKGPVYVRVLGQVKNNCTKPVQVIGQIIFTAKMGRLLVAEEFSPSKDRTIGAGETAIFSEAILPNEPVSKGENWFDVRILAVK